MTALVVNFLYFAGALLKFIYNKDFYSWIFHFFLLPSSIWGLLESQQNGIDSMFTLGKTTFFVYQYWLFLHKSSTEELKLQASYVKEKFMIAILQFSLSYETPSVAITARTI